MSLYCMPFWCVFWVPKNYFEKCLKCQNNTVLIVIMLNVIMLHVIMLHVIMLSVFGAKEWSWEVFKMTIQKDLTREERLRRQRALNNLGKNIP